MKRLQITLLMLCAGLSGPTAWAHEIDDGLEFGASLTVTSSAPVQATLTLLPKVSFKSALVELPNALGGPQIACRFAALIQNQRYTCTVSGSVADDDSGMVIALSGVRAVSIPGHDDFAFKAFTVPNPKFDAAAARATNDLAAKRKSTTLRSKVGENAP